MDRERFYKGDGSFSGCTLVSWAFMSQVTPRTCAMPTASSVQHGAPVSAVGVRALGCTVRAGPRIKDRLRHAEAVRVRPDVRFGLAVSPGRSYFPRHVRPPLWTGSFVDVVKMAESKIATVERKTGLSSDAVLGELGPGLLALGYLVESGKAKAAKIHRPDLQG